jgi:hypothetical protein
MQAHGFRNVRALGESTVFDGITFIKTLGRHGGEKTVEELADLLAMYPVSYSNILMKKRAISPGIRSGTRESRKI